MCIATSGPGATNLVTGLADAMMDSVPLVAITGQVPRKLIGTDGFQVRGLAVWFVGVIRGAAAYGLWGGGGGGGLAAANLCVRRRLKRAALSAHSPPQTLCSPAPRPAPTAGDAHRGGDARHY